MRKALFLVMVSWSLLFPLQAQDLQGYWQGYLALSVRDSLALGVYIEQQGDSITKVELDSPDQYTLGLEVDNVKWAEGHLSWRAPSISASFVGTISADGQQLEGTFLQGSVKLPITLSRGYERKVLSRPQTPHAPFPYTTEEIRLRESYGRFDLIRGTLSLPTQQPKALVILISGSGWQDRDESLFGHKPFLVIADHLTRQGYVVYRYDDFPQAIFAKSTTYDFADGVSMIIDSLSQRADLKGLPVGLLGHSEGSLVAQIVAARDRRVAFIISLGGVAQKPSEVLLYQARALHEVSGDFSPEEIDNSVELSAALYEAIEHAKSAQQAAKVVSDVWDAQCVRLSKELQERYGFTPEKRRTTIAQIISPWFYTFFHLNPKKQLKRMKCPLLALGGERDLQVDAQANNRLFERYLPKNQNHRFEVVPQANHLLQTCLTGAPDEYGKIEETIQPAVLQTITEWLDSLDLVNDSIKGKRK